jgi:hypothetical protein
MPMSADKMADDIYKEMTATYEGMDGSEDEMKKYIKVFTAGIIKHLKTNMNILPGTFTNSGGNVTGIGKVE